MRVIFLLILCFLFSIKTFAHPHIWVENSLQVNIKDKKITSINANWVYDEFYSTAVFFESDLNSDKKLSPEENLKLMDRLHNEFEKNNFFTHLKLNGQKITGFKIENFNAEFKNDVLTCSFKLVPEVPVNFSENSFSVSFFDKTYFKEIYFNEKMPVSISKNSFQSCGYKLYEDMTETYYYGMVNPETIKIMCR